ncbi:MFS transporter [Brevibacterium sp. SIMBA_078]|jgi:sugar phosphate permease|uniref:MFS transporter n=1 Tax=Brevibacterium sp. SIMBA_078 TaxID=3085816 RepID=UPI003978236E
MSAVASPRRTAKSSNPRRIRWIFVALLVIGGIVNYLDRSTLSIGNSTIAEEFDLSATQMGLLLSAFSWPYAIANLPAGYLVDKFGAKKMFAFASGAWSLVGMVTAAANSFGLLYALRVALGVAESPFFTAGLKVNERWFSAKERAFPIALVNTGSQIANALAPPLLTFLLLTMSWRGMFIVVGALGIIVMLIWLRIYRDPTLREEHILKGDDSADASADEIAEQLDEATTAEADTVVEGAEKVGWGTLFTKPNTYFMIIGAFGIFYTVWVYLTWLPSYIETDLGFSLQETGWLAALPFLMGVLGVLTGGWFSGVLIRRGSPAIVARKVPIVGGAVLAAASVFPTAYLDNVPLIIALLSLGYFFSQVPIGCLWTLASDVAPSEQVASLGAIQNFGGFIGAALAPVVTGWLVDTTGNFNSVFLVGAILLIVGAISYGFFVKDRSREAH